MRELLTEKMEKAMELKSFTNGIMSLSLKTDYMQVNSMIDERQSYIERIDNINAQLKELDKGNILIETNEIKELKMKLREVFKEISEIDNLIRGNINNELRNVKKTLNQPETTSKLLNLKA